MLDDGNGVFRPRANRIFPKIGLQVMLRKSVETDANIAGFIINTEKESEPVDLAPSVFLLGKVLNKPNCSTVLDPPSVRLGATVTQHPGFSPLASLFL